MRKMLKILTVVFLFSACTQNSETETLYELMLNSHWENSNLDIIGFDTAEVYLGFKKHLFTTGFVFDYHIHDDTLIISNKILNAYNLKEYKDSISHISIMIFNQDSIYLRPLNAGAEELLSDFESLTFYNPDRIDRYSYYVEKDSLCLSQINKALSEIENNTFTFHILPEFPFRQEKEFSQLLDNENVRLKVLRPGIPIRDCYRETMDYYLRKNFEEKFFSNLLASADTIMLLNNRNNLFEYYACDELPYIAGKKDESDQIVIKTVFPIRIERQELKSPGDFRNHYPFMDIGFVVDTLGTISEFKLSYFNALNDWNHNFRDDLYRLGLNEINMYPVWEPGKILGEKVRVRNNVRVIFKNLENE